MEVWGGNQIFDADVAMPGLDAWVYCKPYRDAEGGGDVYYVSSCATGRITRLLVADVSGHGSAVAEQAISLRTLMRKHVNYLDQTLFVRSMNQQFAALSQAGCFATALVTTFFAPTRSLSLCNAGHPPPLYYSAAASKWSFLEEQGGSHLDADNVPLGVIDLADYQQFSVELAVGDLVLCYTDSLIESKGCDGEMLQTAGLMRIVSSLDASKPQQFIPSLLTAISGQLDGNLGADDVTVLLFRPNGQAQTTPLRERFLAPWRIVKAAVQSVGVKGAPVPWPQWSVANIGGAMFSFFNRFWRGGTQPPASR